MKELFQFGAVPVDNAALKTVFSSYRYAKDKLVALERRGDLLRLKRGLYIVSPEITRTVLSTELIANHIYGPSYVSRESALRFYGLIPERVHVIQSLTTKRSRHFKNELGYFNYTQCAKDYFPVGIQQIQSGENTFLMASPEKALCDLIIFTPNLKLRFKSAMYDYLQDNLRLDMEQFKKMDVSVFRQCAEVGKKKEEINNLIKLIEK